MALAPRPLATRVLICRMVAVVLQATALMYVELAGNLWFSVFIFLKAVLATELPLNAARLIYDVAQVFFQKPLPALRWEMMGLVAADWVMMLLLFAAGSSSLAVEDFVEKNIEALRVATARDVRTVQGLRRAYLTGVGFHCPGRLRYAPSTKDLGSRRRRRSRCMMGGQLVPKDGG